MVSPTKRIIAKYKCLLTKVARNSFEISQALELTLIWTSMWCVFLLGLACLMPMLKKMH
jgi:hypothetical protein